jgi:hypothetical protein
LDVELDAYIGHQNGSASYADIFLIDCAAIKKAEGDLTDYRFGSVAYNCRDFIPGTPSETQECAQYRMERTRAAAPIAELFPDSDIPF